MHGTAKLERPLDARKSQMARSFERRFERNLNKLSNGRKLSPRRKFFGQIGSLIFENDKFFKPRSETFAGMHSSIKWQPVLEQYSAEKKNPAVAAAGRMTRKSFRRLVQEETVSEGESTRLGVRVSTPLARYVRSVG